MRRELRRRCKRFSTRLYPGLNAIIMWILKTLLIRMAIWIPITRRDTAGRKRFRGGCTELYHYSYVYNRYHLTHRAPRLYQIQQVQAALLPSGRLFPVIYHPFIFGRRRFYGRRPISPDGSARAAKRPRGPRGPGPLAEADRRRVRRRGSAAERRPQII